MKDQAGQQMLIVESLPSATLQHLQNLNRVVSELSIRFRACNEVPGASAALIQAHIFEGRFLLYH